MRNVIKSFSIVCVLGIALTVAAKHDGRYLNELSLDYETPHLKWNGAKDEKLKVLFIVPRRGAREPIELIQRFPMDYQAVTTSNAGQLAAPNAYASTVEGTGTIEKENELLDKVKTSTDIIVLGNVVFDTLPPEAKFRILSKVAEGSGLVVTFPRKFKLKKMLSNPVPGTNAILDGVSRNGFPEIVQEIPDKELVKTYRFGKGRICLVDWKNNHDAYWGGNSLTPPNPYSRSWAAEYENMLVLILRATLWTAKDSELKTVCFPDLKHDTIFAYGKMDIPVKTTQKTILTYRVRNFNNKVLKTAKIEVSNNTVIHLDDIPAGRYMLDFIAENENGEILDLGFKTFQVASPFGVVELKVEKQSIKDQQPIEATLKVEKASNTEITIELELVDSPYGRIWWKEKRILPAKEKELKIRVANYYMPTLAGFLKCGLIKDDHLAETAQKIIFFPKNELKKFSNIYWGSAGSSYLGALYAPQFSKNLNWKYCLSFPSENGVNAPKVAMLDQCLVPYMLRVLLLPEKKDKTKLGWSQQGRWFLPKSKERAAELEGDHSFYNPKARKLWEETVEYRMKNLPEHGSVLYSLGDENCYSYDAGFSPSDNKEFINFLKQRYGTIEKLNQVWGTKYKSFATVEHMTLKQALDKKCYPAWFDHRLFVEKEYADIHHFLGEEIRKRQPNALVGAEGSMPGNLEQSIKGMEFWGPYDHLVKSELLRSIGEDRLRGLWWGGYVASHNGAHEDYPFPLWKGLTLGTVNSNLWFESTNGGVESNMGADMSFAHYFRKMRPHLKTLNDGLARLLIETPLENNGISVLWSHASDAARLLDQRFVNPEASLCAFIRFCYANGINFDFTTPSRVKKDLKGKKILFLFGISSLDSNTARTIEQFARDGGTVVADFPPALLDQYLKTRQENPLKELFGNHLVKNLKNPDLKCVDVNNSLGTTLLKLKAQKSLTLNGLKQCEIRGFGKGRAILLNFALGGVENSQEPSAPLDSFLKDLLESAHVSQTIQLAGLPRKNIYFRVRQGDGFKVVAILAGKKDVGKTITMKTPGKVYVYSPTAGYITHDSTVKFTLDAPFKVFTLYKNEQHAPRLALQGENIVKIGFVEGLLASADYKIKRGAVVDTQVLNSRPKAIYSVSVRNPNDEKLTLRDQVVTCHANTLAIPVHFAFNDLKGDYTITVKDVNTGLSDELTVELD